MKRLAVVLALFLCLAAFTVQAQEVSFNYEGRIKVQGHAYTGDGYFKFAIVNNSGQVSYWSNDGTSTTGDEPSGSIISGATDGVFNVVIGDSSLTGMAALDASLFNADDKVFLRVWFSDTGGDFDRLNPDRQITNPALLGSQSLRELTLYVDASNGDDTQTGLVQSRPKRTIQAAWKAVPALVRADVTIRLADGVYREVALLSGKSVVGDATISIVGNDISPNSVRVTGADATADTTAVRDWGFHVQNQKSLFIRGILFDYFTGAGIFAEDGSKVRISYCNIRHFLYAIRVFDRTLLDAYHVNITLGDAAGVYMTHLSRGTVESCDIDNVPTGIFVSEVSTLAMHTNTIHNCTYGVNIINVSTGNFAFPDAKNLISNNVTGLRVNTNSICLWVTTCVTYSGNGVNISKANGGYTSD